MTSAFVCTLIWELILQQSGTGESNSFEQVLPAPSARESTSYVSLVQDHLIQEGTCPRSKSVCSIFLGYNSTDVYLFQISLCALASEQSVRSNFVETIGL